MNLIMFDIDGTLVDSYGFDESCYLKAAEIVLGVKISSKWEMYKNATDAGIFEEAIEKYNVQGDKLELRKRFKDTFVGLVAKFIENNPNSAKEIEGANDFIQYLIEQETCKVAIATGGWEETAKLKLLASDIDISGCSFSSSSEFLSRIEIMKSAESKSVSDVPFEAKIYFGDGLWDKEASELLNYRFILVGNKFKYKNQISNFKNIKPIVEMMAL